MSIVTGNRRKDRIKRYGGEGSSIVWVQLKVEIQVLIIVCGCVPTKNRIHEVKEELWMDLEFCSDTLDTIHRDILAEDMRVNMGSEKTEVLKEYRE